MTYIFLAAGRGTRLHPLTLKHPKSLYKLDQNTTVLQRMVHLIKKNDLNAKIVVVVGFMADAVRKELQDVTFVYNPFYSVTNSIASLWFAREYLDGEDDVTIFNGDIVMEERLVKEVVCRFVERPIVLLDSSIKKDGDYNVQVNGDRVLVMSKSLDRYFGEYAGVTKLNPAAAVEVRQEIELMVESEMYEQWYEDALVQMIFQRNFELCYKDVSEYDWTEVDNVSDFIFAQRIHQNKKKHGGLEEK